MLIPKIVKRFVESVFRNSWLSRY